MRVCIAHEEGRHLVGALPTGVDIEVAPLPSPGVQFWAPPFLSAPAPAEAIANDPELAVVQLLTAGADGWRERLPSSVTLCNAHGVHSAATAEWAVTAILAHVRDFPYFILAQARGEWAYRPTGELAGKRVVIIGAGSVGEAVARRLEPFGVSIVRVARTAKQPDHASGARTHGVAELGALLPQADVVVLTVPLTAETEGMVDEEFLAALPDGALLVNAARGPVVRTSALCAQVSSGRIGAALDVTDPEPLPTGHPLWTLPNVLLTPHVAASVTGVLTRVYQLVGDQIRRYASGVPLINVMP